MKTTTPVKKRVERYRPFVEQDTIKKKTKRLARLVGEFLEKDLDRQALIDNPTRLREIKSLFDECLWEGVMHPFDPNRNIEYSIDEDNRDFYSPQVIDESQRLDHTAWADGILSIQSNLRENFWEPFKEKIIAFQGAVKKPKTMAHVKDASPDEELKPIDPQDYKDLDYFGFSPHMHGIHSYLNVKMPSQVNIYYSLEHDIIQIFNNGIHEIHGLIELIKGLPVSIFRQCKDETCGKWFIVTSGHKREFCSRKCAARYKQRVFRESNREAFNKYHREYSNL